MVYESSNLRTWESAASTEKIWSLGLNISFIVSFIDYTYETLEYHYKCDTVRQ